jgi:ferrous iron transport protein B
MRRETGTWRWPVFAFSYLLALAYGASFATYRFVGWLTSAA